jgi:hypothetical protein
MRAPKPLTPTMQAMPLGSFTAGRPGQGATAQGIPNNRPTSGKPGGPSGGLTRGAPAQSNIGAPAPAPSTGIYSQYGNPVSFINSILGGQPSQGFQFNVGQGQNTGGSASQPPSPQQRAMNYLSGGGFTSTSNPVAPGSAQGAANSPALASQLGAWQNNMNIMQTAQAFGPRNGMAANDYYDLSGYTAPGYTDGGWADALRYLSGGGYASTSNPVTPGSAQNGGIGGPSQVAALNAWQNNMNIAQTAQAFGGGRGPQMANSDYAPGGSMYHPPPAPPAPAPQASAGGSGTPALNTSALTQPMGSGGGLAPIYSTIDGQGTIFDDGSTQRNINQQIEALRTSGNMRGNMKKLARPGMSLDAGSAASVAPLAGQAQADAAAVQASGGLEDQLANSTYQLSGQEAQGSEVLAMANLLRRLQQSGDYQQSAYTSSILGPLLNGLMSSL